MSRSITGLPDNDRDYDTVCGNFDAAPRGETGRELSPEETSAAVTRIWMDIQRKRAEQSSNRCSHGLNLERSRCAQCAPLTEMELGR